MDTPYPKSIKNKARNMRRHGKSYLEIAREIGISKSTAKLWCQDIVLSAAHKRALYSKRIKALMRGPNSSHERRKQEINELLSAAELEVPKTLSLETIKFFGAALYWAEGSKKNGFLLTNSDPLLVKYFMFWLKTTFDIIPSQVKAQLNIHSGQSDGNMKKFWSDLTGIPLENFDKSFIKPLNKKYKKNTLYYGTIRLRVKNGTDYRIRVSGWIRGLMRLILPEVEKIERKWYKLREYMRP